MFENLEVFRLSHALARHAGARQAVVAQNMANADTPDYAARDIAPFSAHLEATQGMRATRPGHLFGQSGPLAFEAHEERGAARDPNGNSVSLETEMLRAVDVQRQHGRALAIYRSGLTVLRTAISRS
ncbi:MAG: flagellar biosynthesis protein FlgB [Alphaproteobacteria bacterium HGW-Alphaproteobacteria-1]|jgi:flagellar basal-body rod protein FlgB|nr:MAG: flagellar biosynthesis protein FlgB [Alphaproteobacteria bacterium HGW-Alphaproteobacteria-1]